MEKTMTTPTGRSEVTPRSKKCGKCKSTVKINDNGLICEYCAQWFHNTCAGVSDDKYTAIAASGDQTHWFCQICNGKVMETLLFIHNIKEENDKMKEDISNIKTEMNQMSNSMNSKFAIADKDRSTKPTYREVDSMIEDKLANLNDVGGVPGTAIKDQVTKAVQEQSDEWKEQERRKNNVIVFRMPEHDTNLTAEVQRFDMKLFLEVANDTCKAEIKPEDIESIDRLGEKNTDASRPRPVRVKLASHVPKRSLFRNLSKLATTKNEEHKKLSLQETKFRPRPNQGTAGGV
jgi:hypothetical protein